MCWEANKTHLWVDLACVPVICSLRTGALFPPRVATSEVWCCAMYVTLGETGGKNVAQAQAVGESHLGGGGGRGPVHLKESQLGGIVPMP